MYVVQSDGLERKIEFEELNQLKKDILWIYDENIGDINSVFVPSASFKMKYWEYLTLNGDRWFSEEEKRFYKIGVLIILLCFCIEYNDVESGDQRAFKRKELPIITTYVQKFMSKNESEINLKNKVLLGLEIASSITTEQLLDTTFEHELMD